MSDNGFGARLRAERERLGLTVAKLAVASGVHRGLIYRIEAGAEASSVTIRRLADAGVHVEALFGSANHATERATSECSK